MQTNDSMNCEGTTLHGAQLAMVYTPMQSFHRLFSPEDALVIGTLFEELNKPLEEEGK